MTIKELLKRIAFKIYFSTVMCYIERDRYFDIMSEETQKECEEMARSIRILNALKNHN